MRTIAAISTGQAAGGIGLVRISGDDAVKVADKIFKSVRGVRLTDLKGYRAAFGEVILDGKPIDEAVALVFRAPKSYTGEDVVELSCHGGLFVTRQVLRAVLESGAVPAEPGEFTKRAFLNGRIDLTEAEAVMELISARGEQAQAAAFSALGGALRKKTEKIRSVLLKIAAGLAAWIDFPDEDIEDLADEQISEALTFAAGELRALIDGFDAGQVVTAGVETAIVGRPNVGKSTLMNLLTGTDRSIVTSVAGTTRDVIEETVTLGNVTLRLADTAGLCETEDAVESLGVERAKKKIDSASLVLAVFDASQALNAGDEAVFSLCRGKKCVAVINKTDLEQKLDDVKINKEFENVVYISAKERLGFEELKNTLELLLGTADFDTAAAALLSERQLCCCREALSCVEEAQNALQSGMTRDAVGVCIDGAIENLMMLTGEKSGESVVEQIFSQFCVGK